MPGPVSAMAMPVSRAPSRQSERAATPERVPTPFREHKSSKTLHKLALSRLVEEFLWIGGNIVSVSKWKLGLMVVGDCGIVVGECGVVEVEKCMGSMQTGSQMVKLRGGSKGLVRYFFLDEHKSCIRWRPSRKNEKAKISIDSIREVCEGNQSEIFQRYADGSFDPNCCFSIYYGEHMESLDLVSGTAEEARTWITGLKYLMAGISDEDSLAKRQRTRDQWLKQTFTEADKNGDGSLSISEVLQLLHKLNVNLPRQKVKQMFKEADTDDNQGTLGFEEFCSFYKMMSTRRDLYLLMLTYGNHKDHLDTDDLARFLEVEQKMAKVTKEHCLEIVAKFEPCPDNQKQGVLGIDGFTNYMRSPAGDIFNPQHYEVNQDMRRPLCHYFIASSHNTYLMGDQLMSQSRVDMYAWVLQAGCRCVEVDCWDGQDGEPIVHHGYTLTSKILFKDVIETINKYAFVKNPYPVILSIENHCSIPQQKKMAEYLVEVLGEKLDLSSVTPDESGRLPSPEVLKGKILVKGKKLPPNIDANAEEGDVSDEDSADEMEDDCKLMNGDTSMNRKKEKTKSPHKGKAEDSTDTADEANTSTNKRTGRSFMGSFSKRKKKSMKLKKASSFEDTDTDQESSRVHQKPSLSQRKKKTMKLSRALSDLVKYTKSVGLQDIEAQAASSSWQVSSLSETKGHQVLQQKAAQFSHFNQRQLSRIYPSSYRVDSSNFNPQPFWNAGCHLVALNYQSEGRVLQLNRAKFYSNGNSGYVLKPECMCQGEFNPMLEDPVPGRMRKQLIIDPFVEVEVIGLPVDCCKEQTRVVDDNGFNPMWEETLVFTLSMPELALIRFLVWDHDPIGQDFIGQRTIAFNSMLPGYRHVYLEGMEEASIFVHIAVNDITGKVRAASGIKGLFHRNPKQASLDSHAAALLSRKSAFGAHLLRRTASAPSKAPGPKPGPPHTPTPAFPDLSTHTSTKERGPREEPDAQQTQAPGATGAEGSPVAGAGAGTGADSSPAAASHPWRGTNGQLHVDDSKGKSPLQVLAEARARAGRHRGAWSEPLKRAQKLRLPAGPTLDERPGVFARVAVNGSGRVGVASNCIKCVIGSKESPEVERRARETGSPAPREQAFGLRQERACRSPTASRQVQPQPGPIPQALAQTDLLSPVKPKIEAQALQRPVPVPLPRAHDRALNTLAASPVRPEADPYSWGPRSCSVPRRRFVSPTPPKIPAPPPPTNRSSLRTHLPPPPNYGSSFDLPCPMAVSNGLSDTDSSSCGSLSSLELPPDIPVCLPDNRRRAAGTLQREMNALFAQKMDEIRSKSPLFFAGLNSIQRLLSLHQALDSISEELSDRPLSTSSSSCTSPISPSHPLTSPVSPSTHTDQNPDPHLDPDQERSHSPLQRAAAFPASSPPCPEAPPGSQGAIETPDNQVTSPHPHSAVSMQVPEEDHGKAVARRDAGDAESPSPTQRVNALRALFDQQGAPQAGVRTNTLAHTPVRRTRSEGQVRGGGAAGSTSPATPTPEVVMDATLCDRLWSTLDGSSHRDSVSSSSSISSNDTVIDLSLPNLASRSPRPCPAPPTATSSTLRPSYATPPTAHQDTPRPVSKSKSNPNLRQEEVGLDELSPRPLSKEPRPSAPPLMQRRHTWSRLYMEGLKQASVAAAATARSPPPHKPATTPCSPLQLESAGAKSKSLGDLTSDDIACHFESKYRSISRSFLCRPPPRDQRRLGAAAPAKPRNDLAEQLKRLTDVEPLTSSDFSSTRPSSAGTQRPPRMVPPEEAAAEEECEQTAPLRRMSSRSQSRVRYIANRAKQAQERQRLQQGMLGMGRLTAGALLEERGNPEGACSVARSPCSSADLLLSQLPPGPPSPRQNHQTRDDLNQTQTPNQTQIQNQTQTQSPLGPQDNGMFFMLKL
ncbi:hypothetical protein ACEWY4_000253 [Coilia grayii]|uniref:Phosphoinositide phospholipase C n=1 Tax=Coilia grayii TaxID=363190 RepID=A0ABD1KW46_9TELE